MKVLLLLCTIAVAQAVQLSDFYPQNSDKTVPNGDSESSTQISLQVPIIVYGKEYKSISVHTDGFMTLNRPGDDDEALLAAYMADLDSTDQGRVHFSEHRDQITLKQVSRDIHKAYPIKGKHFHAISAFIVTWSDMTMPGANSRASFTVQCILASNQKETYVIFLYPEDGVGKGAAREEFATFNARVGFQNGDSKSLEITQASELIGSTNHGRNGEWIFKVGNLRSKHMKKVQPEEDISRVFRRQSGFAPVDVDVFGEEEVASPNLDAGDQCRIACPPRSTCQYRGGGSNQCCICNSGTQGNGQFCLPKSNPVTYSGSVGSDFASTRHVGDGSSFEELHTIYDNVTSHAYVQSEIGRAQFAISDLNKDMQFSIQPVIDFGSIISWLFSTSDSNSLNGMMLTGGRLISRSTIRNDDFQFMVDQTFTNSSFDETRGASSISGNTRFFGTLPYLNSDQTITYEDFSQTFTRNQAEITSEGTRTYTVSNKVTKESSQVTYQYSQYIQFDLVCNTILDKFPTVWGVDYKNIWVGSTWSEEEPVEMTVRFAMETNAYSLDGVVVPPDDDDIPVAPPVVTVAPLPVQPEPTEEPKVVPSSLTECEKQLDEANRRMSDNPNNAKIQFPTCMPIGTFAPRQCSSYGDIRCWCVDQNTGVEIPGSTKGGEYAFELDCSDVKAEKDLTDCQRDREEAEQAQRPGVFVFMPLCTAAGAYEPLQQHPDGYYMCVNFFGEKVSQSFERPDCLEPCEKEKYTAETNNIFTGSNEFEPLCELDGSYSPKQCDDTSCFCVDSDGVTIEGTRAELTSNLKCDRIVAPPYYEEVQPDEVRPDEVRPDEIPDEVTDEVTDEEDVFIEETFVDESLPIAENRPSVSSGNKLVFAQSLGINSVDLPLTGEIHPSRVTNEGRVRHTAVGIVHDCSSGNYYWSDIRDRTIKTSPLDGTTLPTIIVKSRIRSPEGLAIDYLSGNIYWTDSGSDTIEVSKLDGSNRHTIYSEGLTNPRGIAVDPVLGKIYWTDWNRNAPKIMVANGDGSEAKVLVGTNIELPNDITFDMNRRRLCFIDAGSKKIECMNEYGENRQVIFSLPHGQTQHPFGLAVDGDMLYYSNWRSTREQMHAVNVATGEDRVFTGPQGAHGHVYGVAVAKSCRGGRNACTYNNGGCGDGICLPTPSGSVCK